MNNRHSAVAFLLAGFLATTSFAADPTGTWRWEHENLAGSGEFIPDVLKLKYENGNVSGTYVSPEGELPIENASLDGDTLHWELNIDAGGRNFNIAWTGNISGDEISGIYQMADATYKVNNGKVDGNTLSWEFDLDAEGQVFNLKFAGKITGDAVLGNVNIGDFGEFPWGATRDAALEAEKWILTLTEPDGSVHNHELMVTDNDGVFSAVYHADGNSTDVKDFTVEEDGSFSFKLTVPELGLTSVFNGTSDGTTASGVFKYEHRGESGELPFTAEKSEG